MGFVGVPSEGAGWKGKGGVGPRRSVRRRSGVVGAGVCVVTSAYDSGV